MTVQKTIPETDTEWFALIKPEINTDPINPDPETVVQLAKQHAKQVVERTKMEVDLERVRWKATWELKERHGYHCTNSIKLSLYSLESNGWQRMMKTVRHELIHVWQYQNGKYDRTADTKWEKSHNQSFERWMSILNVSKRGGRTYATWTFHCPDCGEQVNEVTKREKHQVAQWVETASPRDCPACGTTISDYIIKKEGERVDPAKLPDVTHLSAAEDRVFLYNWTESESIHHTVEWNPKTTRLTSLPGIGEATAKKLGSDLQAIDDLVDEDGLTELVRTAVSTQYHDDLREEVLSLYREAIGHRSDDDLDLLTRVIDTEEIGWWKQIEAVGGAGTIEVMCARLCTEASTGDRLTITFDELDESYRARVADRQSARQLVVEFGSSVERVGCKGTIYVSYPPRGKLPRVGPGPDSGRFLFESQKRRITTVEFDEGFGTSDACGSGSE